VNVRQIAIITAALAISGGAFMWMRTQAAQSSTSAAQPADANLAKIKVLVAKRDLLVGERITPDTLGWQEWPDNGATPLAFFVEAKTPDALKTFENGIVKQEMVAGEPVTDKKIQGNGSPISAMAGLLTPGMRATSIGISAESSVSGFVLPNDRVDILLIRDVEYQVKGQTRTKSVSTVIFENVRVLAIDQAVAQAEDQKAMPGATATVELTPADVQKLRLAARLGTVSLVLRGYADAAGPTLSTGTSDSALAQSLSGVSDGRSNEPEPQPPSQEALSGTPIPINPSADGQVAQASDVKVYRGGK
jgi:pilus assembly protein CpaB